MPLTDPQCRNATCPAGKPFARYLDGGNLYLEVRPSGSKLWRLRYRFAGKANLLALGAYPAVSLRDARRARDAARLQLAAGIDPNAAKQEAKRANQAQETSFEAIARRWWEDWRANRSARHAAYVIRRLEADAFPAIGSRPVDELTAPAFVRLAKSIEARGVADIARRVLMTCGQVMRYAVAHGLAERNPVAEVKPGDVLRARRQVNFARIPLDELPDLLRRIDAYQGSAYTRLAMRLMLLTFARTGELIGARWDEIDLSRAEWKIPAERTKSRRQHLVPLSRQATEVLLTLSEIRRGDLLFPGERDSGTPMSNNTILKALERMGYAGRMTGHGFRGIASTALNELGFRPDVIEAQLAHIQASRVRAAYNHAQYLPERRQLMQAWADHVDALRTGANVVPLHRPAA
ncbi:MAG: tyrosine-type recombinase/integrase [Burkholderiales bacterium]|nr:tyrosine-type recombinase/integrase [Burkholderiales bacterium]